MKYTVEVPENITHINIVSMRDILITFNNKISLEYAKYLVSKELKIDILKINKSTRDSKIVAARNLICKLYFDNKLFGIESQSHLAISLNKSKPSISHAYNITKQRYKYDFITINKKTFKEHYDNIINKIS